MTRDLSTLACILWDLRKNAYVPSCCWIDYSINASDSKLTDGALTGQPYFFTDFLPVLPINYHKMSF